MSVAKLYQTRSAEARMRMDYNISCAKAHDIMKKLLTFHPMEAV